MNHQLTSKDILALGCMTFALFVGAGNIIFPPMVGIQSGKYVWIAATGFLITAVGLPIITLIALSRVGGRLDLLSSPIGKKAGLMLSIVCYLAIGPLFAMPRTGTVSFEVGIAPLISGATTFPLLIYSVIYFFLIIVISLYPSKLLHTVGHILAPIKILALTILGVAALIWPAGKLVLKNANYQSTAFSNGFINGYLTMDTLGALVFGIIIVNAARSRGINNEKLLMRYTIIAGLIAGIGLTLVYLALFKLGSESAVLVSQNANGAIILNAYVQHTFGEIGSFFLATLIFIACMVTAVGLTCASAEFFQHYLPLTYKQLVFILCLFSMVVSNLGLNQLIQFSIPVLKAIYPPCIVLVLLSFTLNWWNNSTRIIAPTMMISLIFGIIDTLQSTNINYIFPSFIENFPLANQGLTWLVPSLVTIFLGGVYDYIFNIIQLCNLRNKG